MEQTATNYDEYLTKRARNRKITMAVISAVVAFLAAAIIVLSCVNIDNNPRLITKPDDYIQIVGTEINNGQKTLATDDEGYDEFVKIYGDCFQLSVLSSIFSNNFGDYQINEMPNGHLEEYKSEENIKSLLGDYYVKFHYTVAQKVVEKDGTEYISHINSQKLTFQTVFFSLSKENKMQDLTFYLVIDGNFNNGQSLMTVTIKANTYHIYQNLGIIENA